MTRIAVLTALGTPPAISLREVPTPAPGPGEICVAIAAAAVGRVDVLIAAGRYQRRPALPWVPGSEAAGTVVALGAGVAGFAPGDRVAVLAWGGLVADHACVPAGQAIRLSTTLPLATAAVLRVAYTTAWHALVDRARARAGERLLVLGAGGAVGGAAIALGRQLELETIASRRGDPEDGVPVDIVVDPVGGAAAAAAVERLAPGGGAIA